MKRSVFALSGVALAMALLVASAAGARPGFHSVGFATACTSQVQVGDPYACSIRILNTVDESADTLRVTSLSARVEPAHGSVASGEIQRDRYRVVVLADHDQRLRIDAR
jgi:hypothetical protein